MKFLAGNPLVRLLIPFLLGIAFAYGFQIKIPLLFLIVSAGVSLSGLTAFRFLQKKSLRWNGADGLLISLLFFLAGAGTCSEKMTETEAAAKFSGTLPAKIVLLNDAVVKEKTVKAVA